ncbi:MAG TPA: GNAT family N-acetyltransferase [Candidatus Acidoferrales bacterium]|nr:GNAT family N-acetyltransferase [Candidatus Acidoferrales bacterium]
MRRLESERLFLEPVTCDNADTLWQIMQAADLRDYQDVPRYTREAFRERVASRPTQLNARSTGRFEWLIRPRDGDACIGWVSLRTGEHGSSTAELGYSLVRAARGCGYATEAVWLVCEEAFSSTSLRRIEAACVVENEASRRVLLRLGFMRIRLQRNGAVVRGRAVDILIFQMEGQHWKRVRETVGKLDARSSVSTIRRARAVTPR